MGHAACFHDADKPTLTYHALRRMQSRHISQADVMAVMEHGRSYHVRGAVIYAMGRRDVPSCREDGHTNDQRLAGVQVVCAPDTEVVLTVYRNHDLHTLRRQHTSKSRFRQKSCKY